MIDKLITDQYQISLYKKGATHYVLTKYIDDRYELVVSQEQEVPKYIELSKKEIDQRDISKLNLDQNEPSFELLNYMINNYDNHSESRLSVPMEVNSINLQETELRSTVYDELIGKIEEIHGPWHVFYNWCGIVANLYNGLWYNYKENLVYDMNLRSGYYFSQGATLGGIIAGLLSFIPGFAFPMNAVAIMLGIVAAVTGVLDHNATVDSYYGGAVYDRFVMVEDSGPYYESLKNIDYEGLAERGNPDTVQLMETETYYSDSQDIFESYLLQRQLAYENYIAQH